MLDTIKYTVRELLRMPAVLIWSLVFPLVLMSVFSLMFGPLDDMANMDAARIAVVEPDDSPEGQAFAAFIDAISEGDEPLFDVQYATTPEEAERLVVHSAGEDDPVLGFVQLRDGRPEVHISDALSVNTMEYTEASILITVMDEYVARSALLGDLAARDPAALSDPAVMGSVYQKMDATTQVDVTHNQPKESVRYYFALLGMAALFGGSVSLIAFQRMRPNLSALGARRAVGGLSHGRAVAATLFACWIVNFACLAVAYLFMRSLVGIDFGGRDAECLLVVAAASLTAVSLGCAISAIPKVPESSKSGMLTAIVCFSAFFAGLYGQPTMELADTIAQSAPWTTLINPAAQIAQAFYSVMYYETLVPLLTHLAVLVIMSVVLFALSVGSLRRQRYASI